MRSTRSPSRRPRFTLPLYGGDLRLAGCEFKPVVDHRILRSISFHDVNGIALGASWWTSDSDSLGFRPDDPELFADPVPVPAVAELAGDGLASTPSTRLR